MCENHEPEIIARLKKEATTNIRVLHAMQCVVLSEENCISDEFYQFLEEQKHRDATKCINMPLRPGFYIDDPWLAAADVHMLRLVTTTFCLCLFLFLLGFNSSAADLNTKRIVLCLWVKSIETNSPVIALYDDGSVIYANRPDPQVKGKFTGYCFAKLNCE